MHFCQRCRILKMTLRYNFKFLATNFARLPGLPRQSRSSELSGDLSRARTSGGLRGPNPDCRVDGRAVPRRLVFLCTRKQTGNPMGTKFLIFQNLHHLLDRMMPHSKLRCSFSDCHRSVLSDELVDFLHVALGCSSSRLTTARLICDVPVSVLKMFHPPSDTAGTHTDISIHTTKSLVDDSCPVSLLPKTFNDSMLTKQHVGDSHFLALHDENVIGAHELILRSCWREMMPLMILQFSL
jgi:hypothetical protein